MELLFSLIGTSLSAAGFYAVHYMIKIAEKNEKSQQQNKTASLDADSKSEK